MRKKGLIKIIEAFIAILLIAGVLTFVISKGYIGKTDISEEVYDLENSILREISLNEEFRAQILSASLSEGKRVIEWNEFNAVLSNVRLRMESRFPNYLECEAKVCLLDEVCTSSQYNEEIFAQSVTIAANLEIYSPRQLKLFCWEK